MIPVPGTIGWPILGGRLDVVIVDGTRAIAHALETARRSSLVALLDIDAVDLPSLAARGRRPGDAYRPLGSPGRRPLKRVLRDRRILRPLRSRLPVIADRDGILWVPGATPAEHAKATTTTRRALALTWSYEDLRVSTAQ